MAALQPTKSTKIFNIEKLYTVTVHGYVIHVFGLLTLMVLIESLTNCVLHKKSFWVPAETVYHSTATLEEQPFNIWGARRVQHNCMVCLFTSLHDHVETFKSIVDSLNYTGSYNEF